MSVFDQPWRPTRRHAHVWTLAGEVCDGIIPRDVGMTPALLKMHVLHRRAMCPVCLQALAHFFGWDAIGQAVTAWISIP